MTHILNCEMEESEVHVHDENCRLRELICEEENVFHIHDASCINKTCFVNWASRMVMFTAVNAKTGL